MFMEGSIAWPGPMLDRGSGPSVMVVCLLTVKVGQADNLVEGRQLANGDVAHNVLETSVGLVDPWAGS